MYSSLLFSSRTEAPVPSAPACPLYCSAVHSSSSFSDFCHCSPHTPFLADEQIAASWLSCLLPEAAESARLYCRGQVLALCSHPVPSCLSHNLKDSSTLTPSIVGSPFPILPLVFPISDYTGYATISTPVSHLKVPFKTRLFQLPTNVAEKAWEHGPRTWAPGTHVGVECLALGSGLVQPWLFHSFGE